MRFLSQRCRWRLEPILLAAGSALGRSSAAGAMRPEIYRIPANLQVVPHTAVIPGTVIEGYVAQGVSADLESAPGTPDLRFANFQRHRRSDPAGSSPGRHGTAHPGGGDLIVDRAAKSVRCCGRRLTDQQEAVEVRAQRAQCGQITRHQRSCGCNPVPVQSPPAKCNPKPLTCVSQRHQLVRQGRSSLAERIDEVFDESQPVRGSYHAIPDGRCTRAHGHQVPTPNP